MGFSLALLSAVSAATAARPNILFIQADDLGWRDLGCYGATRHETPALDRLARQGIRFTDAYAGAPICTPSRAALLTGLHCARLHITGQPGYKAEDTSGRKFRHPDFRTTLPPGTPTIARTLARAGYETVLVGKWGFDDDPRTHGFDSVIGGPDETLTAATRAFLQRERTRPFFVHLNYTRPHTPLKPSPELLQKARSRSTTGDGVNPRYAADVATLDREIERVIAAVDDGALAKNTVVIATSDNGAFLGYDHERIATNTPLREGKASLYEGGLRVPLIVRWPGVTRANSVTNAPVHGVDWHATLAEMAGVPPPAGGDGRSFISLLRGRNETAERMLYWHYPHYRRAIAGVSASPSSAMRAGRWKLIHFYETDDIELYDLVADPGEAHNLAARESSRAVAMRRQLEAWRVETGAQPPVPNAGGVSRETTR